LHSKRLPGRKGKREREGDGKGEGEEEEGGGGGRGEGGEGGEEEEDEEERGAERERRKEERGAGSIIHHKLGTKPSTYEPVRDISYENLNIPALSPKGPSQNAKCI
jgi:hypothetical protein